jgi:N6-L-threonylcarbamoyladenine synthase
MAVQSQFEVHEKFGGVVPELASRAHLKNIFPCLKKVLSEADIKDFSDIDCFVATQEPGLVGSLLIGHTAAKTFSFIYQRPFIGCNHIEGHLMSIHLDHKMNFPFLAAVVSGGHTSLFVIKSFESFEQLGVTLDDAAGEAFDKGAKLLGLEFPGGPEIEKYARSGDATRYRFGRVQTKNFDFSFSGIKSELVRVKQREGNAIKIEDAAASYQAAIFQHFIEKLKLALIETKISDVVIVGGVAKNMELHRRLQILKEEGVLQNWYSPRPEYCTDNAAMIGALGYQKFIRGEFTELTADVKSTVRPKRSVRAA